MAHRLRQSSKAVADGAVIWRIKSSVTSRAPRFSFGVWIGRLHDPDNDAHAGRHSYYNSDGLLYVSGCWSQIVRRVRERPRMVVDCSVTHLGWQGVVIHADSAVRQSYLRKYDTPTPDLSRYTEIIYAFTFPGLAPEWLTNTNGVLPFLPQVEGYISINFRPCDS